CLQSELSPRTF
nr:immunoglobulin light chain junction region [Macaca mulatta]